MEVTCSSCNTKLNIPDDKLPKDQMVRVNCPKCKNKIAIEPQGSSEKVTAQHEDYSSDDSLEFYDDEKLALVMADESIIGKVKTAVEEREYRAIKVSTIREALSKLRFHHFDLIVIADGFDGQEIAGGPIMNYLNHMAMFSRRRIFLTLISDKYKSMDNMMAYAMSANMVLNTKDLERLSSLLKRGILEHEKFYKVFLDTLVEEGKM